MKRFRVSCAIFAVDTRTLYSWRYQNFDMLARLTDEDLSEVDVEQSLPNPMVGVEIYYSELGHSEAGRVRCRPLSALNIMTKLRFEYAWNLVNRADSFEYFVTRATEYSGERAWFITVREHLKKLSQCVEKDNDILDISRDNMTILEPNPEYVEPATSQAEFKVPDRTLTTESVYYSAEE